MPRDLGVPVDSLGDPLDVAEVQPCATLTLTYRDYWASAKSAGGPDHRPYRNMMVSEDGTQRMQLPLDPFDRLFRQACVSDGDEVTITIRKTGRRPFGNRRVRLTKPHTYTLETEAEAAARLSRGVKEVGDGVRV